MQDLIKAMKALSDETRLRILKVLLEKECCVCEVMQALDISQSRASRSLGILQDTGFLRARRDGVWIVYSVNWQHFGNCATICMFPLFNYSHLVELVNGATGWNTTVFELMKVGERALALARVFNAREGYTAKDDILPERFYEAFNSGLLKDKEIGRETMHQALQTYYKMAGWDPERAIPTAEKLQELDLGWVVEELGKTVIKK